MFELPPAPAIFSIILVVFFAIGIHEYMHAKFADMAGDPTPRYFGRVTLNLTKHFEVVGTIMMVLTSITGIGIGWGKPVPMDPSKMRNPRWDHFAAVLAGPISNLGQAVIYAVLWRFLVGSSIFVTYPMKDVIGGYAGLLPCLLCYGVLINLSLFFFNLIPLGPLDGMWILGTFLGDKQRHYWTRWNLTTGQFVFLGIVILGQLTHVRIIGSVIEIPVGLLFWLLIGLPPGATIG